MRRRGRGARQPSVGMAVHWRHPPPRRRDPPPDPSDRREKNEIYPSENVVGPFLVHKRLGPRPPFTPSTPSDSRHQMPRGSCRSCCPASPCALSAGWGWGAVLVLGLSGPQTRQSRRAERVCLEESKTKRGPPPCPPPKGQRDHRGTNRNLQSGKSDQAIFGTHSCAPPPPHPPFQYICGGVSSGLRACFVSQRKAPVTRH